MREAAEALKLTAQNLLDLKVIDKIVSEPIGGAHRNKKETISAVGGVLDYILSDLEKLSPKQLIKDRREKFLVIGSKGLF